VHSHVPNLAHSEQVQPHSQLTCGATSA
jgi:hypothetical protein